MAHLSLRYKGQEVVENNDRPRPEGTGHKKFNFALMFCPFYGNRTMLLNSQLNIGNKD